MDENDTLGLRMTEMNNADTDKCPHMSAVTVNTVDPVDVESLDVKPELLNLSENTPRDMRTDRLATKACQTDITICDEFWDVSISPMLCCEFSRVCDFFVRKVLNFVRLVLFMWFIICNAGLWQDLKLYYC